MEIDIDGPEGPDYDRAYWWGPLEAVAELVKDMPEYEDFDIDDFMVMCRYTQAGVRLIEYKHIHTRRSIALTEDGRLSFGFVPPAPTKRTGSRSRKADTDTGFYAPDRALIDALDRLELPLGAEMKRSLERWVAENPELVAEGSSSDGGLPAV